MERMFRIAAVLSVLMKVYTIHINVMLVLQSCTDPLHIVPGSSSETIPAWSDGTYDVKVEEDIEVIEECFPSLNEEEDIGIKQEEIPEDVTFLDVRPDPDEISYVCICLVLDTFYQCPEMSVVFVMPIFLAN
jgi:hypothetical protein